MVLPEDSGPYISTILHFAYHPHSAISSPSEPDENVSILVLAHSSHNFIIDHFPNCFSIIDSALFKASCLFIIIELKINIYNVYKKSI